MPPATGASPVTKTVAADTSAAEHAGNPGGIPPGKLTRASAAERLGVSISTLRRLEGIDIHPTTGPGGVRLFDPADVDALAQKRKPRPEVSPGGELAAQVFALFQSGAEPVDVVVHLKLDPERVASLHRTWCEMRCVFTVSLPGREKIARLLFAGPHQPPLDACLKSEAQLIGALQESTACGACDTGHADYCERCYLRARASAPAKHSARR